MFKKLFNKNKNQGQGAPQEFGKAKPMAGIGNVNQKVDKAQEKQAPKKPVQKKKGEINDLLNELNSPTLHKNIDKCQDVLTKTIKFMTMGFDVSPLFTPIVNLAITKDMIIKKMCYQYLVATAKQNEDLSLLAINTFLKDIHDENPLVRGAAIRSLTSLRVPTVVEYMMAPIGDCLGDRSPYVRRNAVIGLLKAFHIDEDVVRESGLLDSLPSMLSDDDAIVVVDVIRVIQELNIELTIDQTLIYNLLNRLGEFNEWCMSAVLDLAARYTPSSPEEMLSIMNLLEPAFRQSNTAVVIATVNCYLKYTKDLPQVLPQVYSVIKQPLLTLMSNPNYDLSYGILTHLKVVLQRDSSAFQDEYRQFFIRYNEHHSIQCLKIQILPLLANEDNYEDICSELVEYVVGTIPQVSREAIRAVARVGLTIEVSRDIVIETLIEFLDVDLEHVRSETMCVFQDLLRNNPAVSDDIVPVTPFILRKMEDPKGKAACLWILGNFPLLADEAPYVVESLIDDYEYIESLDVKMQLLTTTMKLFFARAPEVQKMLGRLLKAALEDTKSPDLHDRALLYYRLLELDVETAKAVVGTEIHETTFDRDEVLEETLFEEFNTLSVIYHMPASHFLADKDLFVPELAFETNEGEEEEVEVVEEVEEVEGEGEGEEVVEEVVEEVEGGGDLMNMDGGEEYAEQAQGGLELIPNPFLDPPSFQKLWGSLPDAAKFQQKVTKPEIDAIVQAMKNQSVIVMASGDKGTVLQFFFYGQDSEEHYYLILIMLQKASATAAVTIKTNTDSPDKSQEFIDLVKYVLSDL